jgi:pyrroline-5-carboxylate reductase
LILVAIKPQEYPALAPAVQHILAPDVVVLSCMAGISLSALSSALGGHRPVVRSMPNLPVQVGEGMIVYMTDPSISPEATALVEAVLRPCGRCLRVFDEMLLDAATALSGSGTGYVAYFMEEMVKAGESLGFSSEDAELIVGQTILGAAAYWRSTMRPAREIREMVTSPNGTTAAALSSLHAADVGRHIREAIFRAYDRSRELGGLAPPSR